jgi:5-methyltetrahydropteroyltriglutamate--homocysteine methyltransferase
VKRSSERILTSHAGSLPRPPELLQMVNALERGESVDRAALSSRVQSAVREVVQKQAECGIDIVNDGEESKSNFTNYVRQRLAPLETRELKPGEQAITITRRDMQEFAEYFQSRPAFGGGGSAARPVACVGPLRYIGQEAVQADIANFKAALQGVSAQAARENVQHVTEAFLPAVTPGTIEHWLHNEHYGTEAEFLGAIADAMHEEYQAIVDAGFILQIDDPDLPDGWLMYPEMDVPAYQKYASVRVEALNHALRGIPQDRVRLHVCWGSYHGPHKYDIPLKDIVGLILQVRAECYSIEASNPRHEHEWRVWETVKLPQGKSLMPGVVGHASDFIEHPQLVAERLVRYAELVGRENVIAGTDCGLGTRVGHPKICWAKFEAMAEGARLATKELWGRA